MQLAVKYPLGHKCNAPVHCVLLFSHAAPHVTLTLLVTSIVVGAQLLHFPAQHVPRPLHGRLVDALSGQSMLQLEELYSGLQLLHKGPEK